HYGSFGFNLVFIKPDIVYKGKREQLLNHKPLGIAITADSEKLERVCHDFDFYFIGNTLNEKDL
nr:hypothetical protein [Ignavibacteriaceae bacterium]